MAPQRHVLTLTANGSGAVTGYTPVLSGRIAQIHYVKNNYANTVDFVITSEATEDIIWSEENVTASTVRAPRLPNCTTAGVATTYAATFPVYVNQFVLAADRVKVVVSNAGSGTVGTFHVVLE